MYATWAEDAVWHVLDATRYQGDYTRDEYFTMLGTNWAADMQDYVPEVVSCQTFGDDLVVVHLRSSGTHVDGPVDAKGCGLSIAARIRLTGWCGAPGDAAQCDLWFPPKRIPLEDGTTATLPVLVIVAAHSRFICAAVVPTRQTPDLLLGTWSLIERFGVTPGATRTVVAARRTAAPRSSPWWHRSRAKPRLRGQPGG